MDLLISLSLELNFTYELHVVHDNNYGGFERVSPNTEGAVYWKLKSVDK